VYHLVLTSIIIITLNEEENIESTIISAKKAAQTKSGKLLPIEIIISDGGSTDDTIEIAKKRADKVIHAPKGRYKQLNAGAKGSTGDILLFLHADTILPKGAIVKILHTYKNPCVLGGGFKKVWNWSPNVKRTKFINILMYFWEGFGNWTVRFLKSFPGDNAIFVNRKIFEELGGFAPMWICEDFDFSLRLKKLCRKKTCNPQNNKQKKSRIVCINSPVKTSTRRFEKYGFLKVLRLWFFIYWLWRLGMPSDRLKARFNKYAVEPEKVHKNFIRF